MKNMNDMCIATLGIDARQAKQFLRADTATAARHIWDYRVTGRTRPDAITEIKNIIRQYRSVGCRLVHRKSEWYHCHRYDDCRPPQPHVAAFCARRRAALERAALRAKIDQNPKPAKYSDIELFLRGYESGHYSALIPLADGRQLLLQREETVEWDKRGKKYWPTSSLVSYAATMYSADCDQIARRVFSRRGDWMAKIAAELGLPTSPKSAITLSAANLFPPNEERQINGVHMHSLAPFGAAKIRLYCATYAGQTYHADSPREAVAGLRAKIEAAKPMPERRMITRDDTRALHFCQAGVEQFLADAGLPENTERIDRRKLQAIVTRMDSAPYRSELSQLGIAI